VYSPTKDGVELFAASRNFQHALSLLPKFMSGLEAASCRLCNSEWGLRCIKKDMSYLALRNCIFDLVHLDLTETLDLE
jgi:hypothetical protein